MFSCATYPVHCAIVAGLHQTRIKLHIFLVVSSQPVIHPRHTVVVVVVILATRGDSSLAMRLRAAFTRNPNAEFGERTHARVVNEARSGGLEVQSRSLVVAFEECVTRVRRYILHSVLRVTIAHSFGFHGEFVRVNFASLFLDDFCRHLSAIAQSPVKIPLTHCSLARVIKLKRETRGFRMLARAHITKIR